MNLYIVSQMTGLRSMHSSGSIDKSTVSLIKICGNGESADYIVFSAFRSTSDLEGNEVEYWEITQVREVYVSARHGSQFEAGEEVEIQELKINEEGNLYLEEKKLSKK